MSCVGVGVGVGVSSELLAQAQEARIFQETEQPVRVVCVGAGAACLLALFAGLVWPVMFYLLALPTILAPLAVSICLRALKYTLHSRIDWNLWQDMHGARQDLDVRSNLHPQRWRATASPCKLRRHSGIALRYCGAFSILYTSRRGALLTFCSHRLNFVETS